jgi:hypothetical protein
MKKALVLYLLSISFLFAIANNSYEKDANKINENILNGATKLDKKNVDVKKDATAIDISPGKKDTYNYEEEIILNLIRINDGKSAKSTSKDGKSSSKQDSNNIANNSEVDYFGLNKDKENKDQQNTKTDTTQSTVTLTAPAEKFKGRCVFHSTFLVTNKKQVKIACKTENKGSIMLVMDLVPKNEEFALNGVPKYIIDANDNHIMIDSELSTITNIDDLDTNIASEVNTREIEQYNNIMQKEMAKQLAKASEDYMNDKRDENVNEQSSTDQNGNVVVTKNRTGTDATDYLGSALITGTFKIIEKVAESMEDKFPYLYKVEENSIINIDLIGKGRI